MGKYLNSNLNKSREPAIAKNEWQALSEQI